MTTTTKTSVTTTTTLLTNNNISTNIKSSKTPPILKRASKRQVSPNNNNNNNNNDMWKQIELRIQENLDNFELTRKYCAYCGRNDNYENLARCYGCQMVYYCSQEHQLNDWLEHMQKCAELEWVALGELIQSIPAPPTICELGQYWNKSILDIQTWTDWFEIRPHILKIARNTAKIFDNIKNINKKREPNYEDIIDGLLAAVTDSMTYSLTIGNTLVKIGINPCVKPVCIHCLHSTNDFNLKNIDLIKKQFYELCNMFPGCKGFEIVFIGTDINTNEINEPYMKTDQKYLPRNQLLYISGWHGTYTNYIKYQCQIEGYSLPDLIVSFHPNFTSSPYKLINEWTDDLKIILINNFSCLFTFYDSDEKLKAYNTLNAFQTNILYSQLNQFSSLLMKQLINKPNHVYANNSYYIIIRGFIDTELDLRYNQQIQQQSTQQQQTNQQAHACVQTIGIDEPENHSLKHVNGKLHLQTSKINKKLQINDDNESFDDQIQNDKIPYRPLNFLKQTSSTQTTPPSLQHKKEQQMNYKNYECLNDNNLKKYLNSGFATPSSETSGSYYQPRLNLTFSTTNHNHNHKNDEQHDSTDEALRNSHSRSYKIPYNYSKKIYKSKSLQKIEFPNADDDDDDDDEDDDGDDDDDSINENEGDSNGNSNNSSDNNTQYGNLLPEPKPRVYGTLGNFENEEKPTVKPRKPKPKPRTMLSNSDETPPEVNIEVETKQPSPKHVNKNIEQQTSKAKDTHINGNCTKESTTPSSPKIVNNIKRPITPIKSSVISPRSPNQSVLIPQINGFVSQMKSIFESQLKNQESNLTKPFLPSSKTKIQNLTATLANSTNSPLFKVQNGNNTQNNKLNKEIDSQQQPPPLPSVPPPPAPPSTSIIKNELDESKMNDQNEYMNIDNLMTENKFQTIDELNNSTSKSEKQQAILNEFRILDYKTYELQRQRSLTPSNKSLTFSMNGNSSLFIKHIPDPVDVVNIKYEGERRVLVPGYLTSADILRNSLISTVNEDSSLSLKDKLRQQQIEQEKDTKSSIVSKNLINPTAVHVNEKNDLHEMNLTNKPKLAIEIGSNSLFQKIVKEDNNDNDNNNNKIFSSKQPILPPPLPQLRESSSPPIPPPLPQLLFSSPPPSSIYQKVPQSTPIVYQTVKKEEFSTLPKFDLKATGEPVLPPTRPNTLKSTIPEALNNDENKILKLNIDDKNTNNNDDNDDNLYSFRTRSKSMSGVLKLFDDDDKPKSKPIINFDLFDDDYSSDYSIKKTEPILELQQVEIHKELSKKIEEPQMKFKIDNEIILPKIEISFDNQSIRTNDYDDYNKGISIEKKTYIPMRQPPPPPPSVPPPLPPTRTQVNKKNDSDEAHYAVSSLIVQESIVEKKEEIDPNRLLKPRIEQRKESVTGSFDPSDFDSFDEGDTFCSSKSNHQDATAIEPELILPKIEIPIISSVSPINSPNNVSSFKISKNESPNKKNNMINDESNSGRFDPNDFDSFDEDERAETPDIIKKPSKTKEKVNNNNNNNNNMKHQESQIIEQENCNPDEYNLIYFNNNKMNSFKSNTKPTGGNFFRNALNRLSTSKSDKKRSSSVPPSKILNELNNDNEKVKQQQDESVSNVNMKTLQLMNKMQIEHEEKQKRRKLRLLKQQEEQQKIYQPQQQQQDEQPKTPKSEKKFLNSLMSSLFASKGDNSSSSYEHPASTTTTASSLHKNESRRLSLRKLKAKDKAKKQGPSGKNENGDYTSDGELNTSQSKEINLSNSSQSLNFYRNQDDDIDHEKQKNENDNYTQSSYIRSASFDVSTLQSRVGKINYNNSSGKNKGGNEKLVEQLRAELDEEIKSRNAVENANKKFEQTIQPQKPQIHRSRAEKRINEIDSSNESNSLRLNSTSNRKIRSKSVTFLDEITTDDEILNTSNNNQQLNRNSLSFVSSNNDQSKSNGDLSSNENNITNSVTTKRKALLKTGDIRYHCGALTGVGPIRSIMKKSATDLSITLNTPLNQNSNHNENLPRIEMNLLDISTSNTPQMSPNGGINRVTPRSLKKLQSDL